MLPALFVRDLDSWNLHLSYHPKESREQERELFCSPSQVERELSCEPCCCFSQPSSGLTEDGPCSFTSQWLPFPWGWGLSPTLSKEAAFSDSQVRHSFEGNLLRDSKMLTPILLGTWASHLMGVQDLPFPSKGCHHQWPHREVKCALRRSRSHRRWAPETWRSILFPRLLILLFLHVIIWRLRLSASGLDHGVCHMCISFLTPNQDQE